MGSLPATTEATRFGKYSLVARLATGGMAEIFLARLQGAAGFEKLVCIKRILPHLARDKQFVAMFLDEARIAARISHPNVCQVFELGEIEGSYYIAMEYLEGVPLACFRRRDYYGEMPDPRLVAGIAVQACEGLHHAHQLKHTDGSVMEVVHRDISPQNLFVTVDGIVKVLDFGIAKIQDAKARTSTGVVKGTYAYMSPEQLRGERVDRRTDVFAIGIVMWETLMRRHLFRRDTDFLTFQAITSDPIEDVCARRPDVAPALSAVIMTALSRDREQRFATARMLGEAIAAAVPPLTGAAISEEIARAFPAELEDQAALIRVAREGGAFDLEVDRGPSLGYGTDLLTTPTSNLRSSPPASGSPASPPAAPRSSGGAAPITAAPGTPSARMPAAPVPVIRTSWRSLVVAVLALALGGAGAYVYVRVSGGKSRGDPGAERPDVREPAPAEPAPLPVAVPAVADAAPAGTPLIDAGPAAGSADASTEVARAARPADRPADRPAARSTDASPPDAATTAAPDATTAAPVVHTGHPAAPERHPASASSPARPSGPPGFITIDSSPVYAVIYIDGKSYGETPLVHLALPPGRHGVHAVAPSGATRDVRITIESGKVAPASRIEW